MSLKADDDDDDDDDGGGGGGISHRAAHLIHVFVYDKSPR
jgi:hypothetical protein